VGARPSGGGSGRFGGWWTANRDRLSILAIAGVALGGIVCMLVTVLVLVFG
jgi:hypothetical protein